MMKTSTSVKHFDCVEMMHKAQERGRPALEGKTPEEQLEYWRGAWARLEAKLAEDSKARIARRRSPRK